MGMVRFESSERTNFNIIIFMKIKLIPKHQQGGNTWKPKYKTGQHCGVDGCAAYANRELRSFIDSKSGNSEYPQMSGHAWTRLSNGEMLYNGYEGLPYDSTKYSKNATEDRNRQASERFYKEFDSKQLDPNETYLVNMYYKGSPSYQEAWENAKSGTTGTHTGNAYYDHDRKRWMVSHNIHGKVYNEDFITLQGYNRPYGITAIAKAPRANKLDDIYWNIRNFLKL